MQRDAIGTSAKQPPEVREKRRTAKRRCVTIRTGTATTASLSQ